MTIPARYAGHSALRGMIAVTELFHADGVRSGLLPCFLGVERIIIP